MIGGIKRLLQGEGSKPRTPPKMRVLMVCMGNICRSPTAEAVLRRKLEAAGLSAKVEVDSAGTHGYHTGEAPDPRAVSAGEKRGYALKALRARPVRPDDFQHFDWLLAMDDDNLAWLQRKAPEGAAAQLSLLLGHSTAPTQVTQVPDPYYGGPAGFDRVLDLVETACDGVVARIQAIERSGKLD